MMVMTIVMDEDDEDDEGDDDGGLLLLLGRWSLLSTYCRGAPGCAAAWVTPKHWHSLVFLFLVLSSSQINVPNLLLVLLFWGCTTKGWCMAGGP